ncbi:hypothetical protein Abr02nite_48710 [Paractinoplanes brasiliensis]|nr:hypothetical protein Abr02nite_48710 [Actinoplanes brasiliensis]
MLAALTQNSDDGCLGYDHFVCFLESPVVDGLKPPESGATTTSLRLPPEPHSERGGQGAGGTGPVMLCRVRSRVMRVLHI